MLNCFESKLYADRYLCPYNNTEYGQTNHSGFLQAQYHYNQDGDFTFDYESYIKINDILQNKYSVITGEGGIGKSIFLSQIEEYLKNKNIPCKRINLRDLSNETNLFDKIKEFCITNNNEIFILFDAVDEAIDIGITNISAIINDTVDKALKVNQNIKIILTCRENQFPSIQLIQYLNSLYKIESENDNYIYSLCRLREDDVKKIAKNRGIDNTEKFAAKIKLLNLGVFASSPNTLTPLISLYKQKGLSKITCHYDLFEYFMELLVSENDFRKEKDNIGEIKLCTNENILFAASRIAILLKLNNQNLLSNKQNIGFFIEKLYCEDDFYIKKKHLTVKFNKNIIYAALKTGIFAKTHDGWIFAQKTYQDFLAARYLYFLNLNNKEYKKLLFSNGIIHPNYIEAAAYLASKNKNVFNFALSYNPEDIIFSSVNYTDNTQRKKLFKKYIEIIKKKKCVKLYRYTDEKTKFHQTVKSNYMMKNLNKYLTSNDVDLKTTALLLIIDNKLPNFEKNIKKIIFNKNENLEIREYALLACSACNYNNIFQDIYENISEFEKESNDYAIKIFHIYIRSILI